MEESVPPSQPNNQNPAATGAADGPIYCGNGRQKQGAYGPWLALSLTSDDVQTLQNNLDNGWVNVNIRERRQPSASGFTHYLQVDTWKPDPNRSAPRSANPPANSAPNNPPAQSTPAPAADSVSVDDLPF